MTAENLGVDGSGRPVDAGFNEAAADDRGKPRAVGLADGRHHGDASMRPRPMTAENLTHLRRPPLRLLASMRPRPMTAENRDFPTGGRPAPGASMRPRPMTAENHERQGDGTAGGGGFNEAAADDRGKPCHVLNTVVPPSGASMRPRPMTAENRGRGPVQSGFGTARFNEAAADDRGKPRSRGEPATRSSPCFNEAAADDRGKPRLLEDR